MDRWGRLAALAALLTGCGGGGSDMPGLPLGRPTPELGLDRAAESPPWRALDHLADAAYALPRPAEKSAATGVFALPGPWQPSSLRVGRMHVYTTPLPFHTDLVRPGYAPYGAQLWRGTKVLPYVNDAGDVRGGGWFVEDGEIQMFALESPEAWPVAPELRVAELAQLDQRRDWDGVVDPAEFVRVEVTVGPHTQPGLHLPVGGLAGFDVDVPPNATLEWGVAALPDPLGRVTAGARAAVRIDGQPLGDDLVSSDSPLAARSASLAAWAGKRVRLELAAEAGPDGGDGHVVFTSPVIRRPAAAARRVVVVGVDTLRWDALGVHGAPADRSPELDAWAEQSIVFDRAWAPAPRTRPSFRTALTGRWPLAATDAPTVATLFAAQGFRTAGVVANVHLVPRFSFNDGFESWHYENGARASDQVDRGLAWLRAHEQEDSFLFLHLMDPHTWYNAPEPYGSRFVEGALPAGLPEHFDRWHVYQIMRKPSFGEPHKRWIRGAYEGEVAYLSAELSRFLAGLDALGGQTLTVLHSDHGEELWDHGAYEHNHTLYDELVRAVLWVRPPKGWAGGPHRISTPVGLVDLVPTLLDLVGAPAPASDGRSLRALFDPARDAERASLTDALARRPLQLGHLMFDKERWGVVLGDDKYILHTASGQEELYDLTADPHEQNDLAADADPTRLAQMRAALAEATGWPVGSGWRLRLQGRPIPFDVVFDAPIGGAGVIDPEAERETRANLEWGEAPPVPVDAVGSFTRSADGRRVTFTPGPKATGRLLWIRCDAVCPSGSVEVGSRSVALTEGLAVVGAVRMDVRPGVVVSVPPPAGVSAPVEPGQLEALEELGYLDGE